MASLWNAVYFNDSEIITYLNETVAPHVRDVEFMTIDAAIENELHLTAFHPRFQTLRLVATVEGHAPGVMSVSKLCAKGTILNHIADTRLPVLITSEERIYNSLGHVEDGHQRKVVDDLYEHWLDKVPYPGSVSTADVEHRGERLRFNGLRPLAKAEPAQAQTPTAKP